MRISYNWLKQFIKTDWKSEETEILLTDLGLEVEGIDKYESLKGGLEGVVVGHVLTCVQHSNADKLKVTTVDLGDGNAPVQIVCGASNVAAGIKVPVATIGTKLYDKEGNSFEIKKGKIPFSALFQSLQQQRRLWIMTYKKKIGQRVSSKLIRRLSVATGYYNPLTYTMEEVLYKRKECEKAYSNIIPHASNERRRFLERRCTR